MIKKISKSPVPFITSLAVLSSVSIGLLFVRVLTSDSARYLFLIWNLMLAAIVPLIAWWLVVRIRKYGWLHWQQILLTVLWLGFLPNSFYIVTDFIHLRQTYEVSLLYDAVLLMSFVLVGLAMGFVSLYLVHTELRKRLSVSRSWGIVAAIFLASSFAIYLGRFSRWNTWDIILKPAGLLFDVSDRVVNPAAHTETYQTTSIFFVLLLSAYWVVWEAIQLFKKGQ